MNEVATGKTMTVREVAEVLGVSPEAIKKHVRELYPDLMANGAATYLTEGQVTLIKQKMLPTTKVAGTFTSLDIERMTLQVIEYHRNKVTELETQNARLNHQIEANQPKVEFFDQVADSRDALQMRDVAAALNLRGWGRNSIFAFLREKRVLDDRNVPYREFQDRGYFRVVEQEYADAYGDTHINLKTLVYQRGVDFIRNLIAGAA